MARLLPLVLLLAGLAVGFLVSESLLIERQAPGVTAPDGRALGGRDAAAPPGSDAPTAPRTQETAEVDLRWAEARLAELLAGLPELSNPRSAEGMIVRVVDATDAPLAGVTVRIAPTSLSLGVQSIDLMDNSLEEYVRRRVDQHRHHAGHQHTLVSDAEGVCAFTDLLQAVYRIYPQHPGTRFEVFVEGRQHSFALPGMEVRVVATRTPLVPVQVLMPDGALALRADLIGSARFPWSQVNPDLPMPPGRYELRARLGTHYESDPQRFNVPGDGPPPQLVFRLGDARGLRIEVETPGVSSATHVHVLWREAEPGAVPDADHMVAGSFSTSLRTQANGKAVHVARDLVPGEYWVGAGYIEGRAEVVQSVHLGADLQAVVLALPDPTAGRPLRVRVLDGAGAPLKHADLSVRVAGDTGHHLRSNQVDDPDGGYLLVLDRPLDAYLPSGGGPGLVLMVEVDQLGGREIEVTGAEMLVQFGLPGTLTVTIAGLTREQHEEVRVQLQPSGSRSRWDGSSLEQADPGPDGSGSYSITTEAGRYRLLAMLSGMVFHDAPCELAPGPQHVQLTAPPLHRLVVQLPPGTAIDHARLQTAGGWGGMSGRIEGGAFIFDGVLRGEYFVSLGDEDQMMRVDVTGDAQVPYAPMHINALELRFVDPALAQGLHGLRHGDLVVGFDGDLFENVEDLARLGFELDLADSVALELQRGGERHTLTLTRAQFADVERLLHDESMTFVPAER